ncbi:MAG TPA: glycosyltransferase [Burkholderiales bacterium]|nr:glycosyltransferase [Burkholderiales bacterium]
MKNEARRSGGVFIGNLSAESGAATLREALDLAPAARVELIDRADLEADDLQSRLQQAAYLVLPALTHEPMPRALVEAFANAVPVIASRIGSAVELVEPGRNGLLFEPGSARDLARQLAWAEAFPEKMRQMGECARADYLARFTARWSYPTLFGERRRAARA